MFRCSVLFAFCIFFSLAGIAQTLQEKVAVSEPNNSDPHVPSTPRARSNTMGSGRISITRLREPRKAQELYYKAMDAWKKERFTDTERKLEEALNICPRFPEALAFYGFIHAAFQHWDLAEQKLQAAIQTDPTYSPAYIVLAGVYNAENRFDEAEQTVQLGLSAGADTWHVQYEMARSLIGQRDYEGALATADAGLRSKPDGGLLHLAKAHALLGLRKYPEAATELSTFLAYQPSGDGSEQARELLHKIQGSVPR